MPISISATCSPSGIRGAGTAHEPHRHVSSTHCERRADTPTILHPTLCVLLLRLLRGPRLPQKGSRAIGADARCWGSEPEPGLRAGTERVGAGTLSDACTYGSV